MIITNSEVWLEQRKDIPSKKILSIMEPHLHFWGNKNTMEILSIMEHWSKQNNFKLEKQTTFAFLR
jgi:hypothetical protein